MSASDHAAQVRPPRGGSGVLLRRLRAKGDQIAVLVVLFAIWAALSWRLGVYWVSSPWAAGARFVDGVLDGTLIQHGFYTLAEAVVGFILGAAPATLLPFLIRRRPMLVAIIDPFMVGGYGAPKLALAPLFILWFGIGMESKIVLVAVTVFFIVYFSTLAGVAALNPKLVRMAQVMGANERAVLRHIVFPGAVPYIFTGFRVALPYSIGAAVIAELLSANRGLGFLIQRSAMGYDTTGIFVALVATVCIVFVCNRCLGAAEAYLLRWRPPADTSLPVSAAT